MKDENKRLLSSIEPPGAADLEQTPFQVLKAGEYYDPRYGKFKVTEKLLEQLKANFDSKVLGIDVALDVGHESGKGAFAWVKSLDVKDGGLWATFSSFTEEAKRLFREKVYRYFSVEYAPLEKVENGTKVKIADVLKGIALTNRPVIKGMQPTYLSEDAAHDGKDEITNSQSMKAIKTYAEKILSRGKVTREEADLFKAMLADVPEADRKEFEETGAKVEAEAVKTEAEAKKLADQKVIDDAKKLEEGKTTDVKLTEANAKIATLEAESAARKLTEAVGGLMLSESNLTGFAKADAEKVKAFVEGLDDKQRVAFAEVVKAVKTVDAKQLEEIGNGAAGDKKTETADAAKYAEAMTEAKKRVTDDKPLHMALAEVYKEKGLVDAS